MSKKYLSFLFIISLLIAIPILSGCTNEKNGKQEDTKQLTQETKDTSPEKFTGENGERVIITDGQAAINSEVFGDGLAHFYNTELADGTSIYFFVIKDKSGVYRAAANACQVCFGSRMGFRQENDFMVCNTCGNKYPLAKIATEKGGCNPGPINPNLEIKNGKVIIEQANLEGVAEFF